MSHPMLKDGHSRLRRPMDIITFRGEMVFRKERNERQTPLDVPIEVLEVVSYIRNRGGRCCFKSFHIQNPDVGLYMD